MRAAKLQLEHYSVLELFFKLQFEEGFDLDERPILKPSDLLVEVGSGINDDDSEENLCQVKIRLKNERLEMYPYDFRVNLMGSFRIASSVSDKTKQVLLKTNAPSMLFTAARELLLLTSGRSNSWPIMLPTVAFIPEMQKLPVSDWAKDPNRTQKRSKSKAS